ncbi:hypothetical protein CARUB_v10024233mg [Capsella rubella]|uniref:Uncharacterized protein n=1 Tax=Capsella rubella TaxID=81985 RepID=R0HRV9_9BRAS|nr:U4/U6 small nuclear ribonucleoprotein PRP4-like protein [Capsella rubella]EOA28055.1 hypothetical protein CARUB_v10024233mg [Capsella rubella]
MEPNKEDNVSLAPTALVTAPPSLQDASSQPGFSAIPPVGPPFSPPMSPIPLMPHPPVFLPTTFSPPVSLNGGGKTSDLDSDSDDQLFGISEESRQFSRPLTSCSSHTMGKYLPRGMSLFCLLRTLKHKLTYSSHLLFLINNILLLCLVIGFFSSVY